jgi:hypothetical protein
MAHSNTATWIAVLAASIVPGVRLGWRAWTTHADPRIALNTGALLGLACVWIATVPAAPGW